MDKRLDAKQTQGRRERQRTLRTVVEILTKQAAAKDAAINPDLPESTQQAMRARIQKEYREQVSPKLAEMKAIAAEISAQASFYERGALLRREGRKASMQTTAIVQRTSDAGLVQLARDAAADGDRELAGAIALELGGRSLSSESLQTIATALGAIEFPELADVDRLLRPARDLYLQAELEALEIAPTDNNTAARKMDLGRMLGQPVLHAS